MTRYVLRRQTVTGTYTIKTTNPAEVERWLWEALSAHHTESCTITREFVEAPQPKGRPQCEGQGSILEAVRDNALVPDLMAELEASLAHVKRDRSEEPCPICGVSQCPKVGVRPAGERGGGCRLA